MNRLTLGIALAALCGGLACDGSETAADESSSDLASPSASSGSEPGAYGPGRGGGPGWMGMGMGMGQGGMGRGPGRGGMGRGGMGPGDCPVTLEGVSVEQEEVEGGAVMVFRAEDEAQLAELRERVAAMAEHHTQRHGPGGRPPGRGMGYGRPEGITPPPESTAEAVETDDGVRFELRPTDEGALDSLRDHVRQVVDLMQDGSCPWMQRAGATQ